MENTDKTTKILILGSGFVNKGAEAMLRTVQQQLTRRLGALDCWIGLRPVTTCADEDCVAREAGFSVMRRPSFVGKLISTAAGRATKLPVVGALLSSLIRGSITRKVDSFDALIDISGFAFGDNWGHERAQRTLMAFKHLGRWQRPCVLMPQAWGPFKRVLVGECTRDLCREAALFYSRDEQSRSFLAELLGKDREDIPLAPDIAFRLSACDESVGRKILEDSHVNAGSKPIVGIAPNMRVYERTSGVGADNAYLQALIHVVQHFSVTEGAQVVLVAHETTFRYRGKHDDHWLCDRILQGCGNNASVAVVRGRHSTEELKAVVGQMDLLIGSRFHSLIAALSQRIPAVAIGWSHKYVELMQMVQLKDYVVDYSQLSKAQLLELVAAAWEYRKRDSETLKHRVPELESQVDAVFDRVADLIRNSTR